MMHAGVGNTLALAFVVAVAGVKALAEDYKRHTEDKLTNGSKTTQILPNGDEKEITWGEVKVLSAKHRLMFINYYVTGVDRPTHWACPSMDGADGSIARLIWFNP